jgi:hypothetical protein
MRCWVYNARMVEVARIGRYIRLIEAMICSTDAIEAVAIESAAAQARLHRRRVYPPLGVYSQLLQAERSGDRSGELLAAVKDLDDSVWAWLSRRVAGELFERSDWIEASSGRFARLIQQQQSSGEFLPADPRVHPETRWYDELTLLGAMASYAVREPTAAARAAVARSALFHLHETQPDHATSEPWGLLAFVQFAPSLADQVLHSLSMQVAGQTGGQFGGQSAPQSVDRIGGPALLLLTDALYGLRRLLRNGA